jgi:hypothetical protein
MTSAIDPRNPVHGTPTTESVRDNFDRAAAEISLLQIQVAAILLNMPYLPLAGDTMLGRLVLAVEPIDLMDAATKGYVDQLLTKIEQLEERIETLENPNGA